LITTEAVLAALGTVNDPDLHRDLVTLGMIEGVEVDGGKVRFTVVLTTSACPLKAEIEADCQQAVRKIPGVTSRSERAMTGRGMGPVPPAAEQPPWPWGRRSGMAGSLGQGSPR